MTDLKALRRRLRQARRDLSASERRAASGAALARVRRLPRFLRARRIALYAGVDGEICPLPLVDHVIASGKTAYLPLLHPIRSGRLLFCAWRSGDRLRRNRFGIAEPIPTARNLTDARELDLVIVPLLGFDDLGHRLGMGGGFYDRTFAFRRRNPSLHRPYLLGLAFELQRTDALASRPWDVDLDAVATEAGVRRFT